MFVESSPLPVVTAARNERKASSLHFTLAKYDARYVVVAVCFALLFLFSIVVFFAKSNSFLMTVLFTLGVMLLATVAWLSYYDNSMMVLRRGIRLPLQSRLDDGPVKFLLKKRDWKKATRSVFREVYGQRLWQNMEMNSGAVVSVKTPRNGGAMNSYSHFTTDIIEGHMVVTNKIFDELYDDS